MTNNFEPEKIVDLNVDYYAVLGIIKENLPPNDTKENKKIISDILSNAYTETAFLVHPNNGGTEDSFCLVLRAHTILSDEILRTYYDSGGKIKPRIAGDDTVYELDWESLGNYRQGTLADTVGFGFFLEISSRKEELSLTPAFYPKDSTDIYEWDWVIGNNIKNKLSLSLVPDELEVLRLTSGKINKNTVPFKIYLCIPQNNLQWNREKESESIIIKRNDIIDIYKPKLTSAVYSDINLLETTDLEEATDYFENQLAKDLIDYQNGTFVSRFTMNSQTEQVKWIEKTDMNAMDIKSLQSILLSKAFVTEYDENADKFLQNIPSKINRKS